MRPKARCLTSLLPAVLVYLVAASALSGQKVRDISDIEKQTKDGVYQTSDLRRFGSGGQLTFEKKGKSIRGLFTSIGRSACYEGTISQNIILVGSIEFMHKKYPTEDYYFEEMSADERERFGEFYAATRLVRFPHDLYHDPSGPAATRAASKFNACLAHLRSIGPNDSVCGDRSIANRFDSSAETYHRYPKTGEKPIRTLVCNVKEQTCTRALVFSAFVSQANFVAPTPADGPVQDCRPIEVLLLGKIRQVVNKPAHFVTNYTVVGHRLHPGKVTRSVIEVDDAIYVDTFGEGVGELGPANEFFSSMLWTDLDEKFAREFRRTMPSK